MGTSIRSNCIIGGRAQTSNQGFRKFTDFYRTNKTTNPTIETVSQYGNDESIDYRNRASADQISRVSRTSAISSRKSKLTASHDYKTTMHSNRSPQLGLFSNDKMQVPNNMNEQLK